MTAWDRNCQVWSCRWTPPSRRLTEVSPTGPGPCWQGRPIRCGRLLADVRRVVRGLRPPVVDELGLSAAVQELAASLVDPSTRIEVHSEGDLTSLPAAVEAAAYRVAAEALTNVARHAGASTVRIEMAVSPTSLELKIADDGRGLAPSSAPGVGLISMRERAAELGGTFEVLAADQGGTVCRAHLPLLETSGDDQHAG
jgi:signal transduction histidine kinase